MPQDRGEGRRRHPQRGAAPRQHRRNRRWQGTSVDTNPAVLTAIAAYRRAAIMRSHMHIVAPIDGVVAQRTVQLGQQVAAGTPMMAVVPLDRVWVDANFRETQLQRRAHRPARDRQGRRLW